MSVYFQEAETRECDQWTHEDGWETYIEEVEPGWYYYGEDGPSCPTGPFATEEEARSAFSFEMDRHWEDLVGPLESLQLDW